MVSVVTGEKSKISREKGITLIALVVTIIVLLILAGVSIQMLTGQNGILRRAKEAKEKTEIAELKENIELEIMDEIIGNNGGSIDKNKLREILVRHFGEEQVPAENDPKWDKFPEGFIFKTEEGYEIDIAEMYDESLGKMAAGTVTTVPEGKEWKDTVTPVADGEGNVIPVPNGFYYVDGTKDTGFIISDEENDDINNTAKGNQFVWVPCSGQEGEVEYEKKNGLATTWKKNNYSGFFYKEYNDWKDEGGDLDSVEKYGGFYVARFEAGIPDDFYVATDGTEYIKTNKRNSQKDVTTYVPVSKKNIPCWNFISQVNADSVSKKMYEAKAEYVTSQLIDSYAWDTIVEWIKKTNNDIFTNPIYYGNYTNNTKLSLLDNGLYALHVVGTAKSNKTGKNKGWLCASTYSVGSWKREVSNEEITIDNISKYSKYSWTFISNTNQVKPEDFDYEQDTYRERVEIATGATNQTKINNIYDIGGNMWEWTTETGYLHTDSDTSGTRLMAVRRGQSFEDGGASKGIAIRFGDYGAIDIFITTGFRVVLYIK